MSQEQRDEIYIFQEMVGLGIMSAYPFGPSALADGSNGVSWNHIYTLDMLGHSNKCTETESQKIPGTLRGIMYYQIRGYLFLKYVNADKKNYFYSFRNRFTPKSLRQTAL